jgi:thiol-disulfide isomerase/thioredoxin
VALVAVAAITLATSGFFSRSSAPSAAAPGGGSVQVGQVAETDTGGPQAQANLEVGTPAPDLKWTIGDQSGSVAGLNGHPAMLVFFATWCPHCQAELPIISKLSDTYAPQGLKVIGISASPVGQDQRSAASLGDVEGFARRYGASFPLLFDRALVGARRYGVRSYPTIYLVDANGTIKYANSGEVPRADLAKAIEGVL